MPGWPCRAIHRRSNNATCRATLAGRKFRRPLFGRKANYVDFTRKFAAEIGRLTPARPLKSARAAHSNTEWPIAYTGGHAQAARRTRLPCTFQKASRRADLRVV